MVVVEKIAVGWVPSYFMEETTAAVQRSLGTPYLSGRAVCP